MKTGQIESWADLPKLRVPWAANDRSGWHSLQDRVFTKLLRPLGQTDTQVVRTLALLKIKGRRNCESLHPLAVYLRVLLPGVAVEVAGQLIRIGPPGSTMRVIVCVPRPGCSSFMEQFRPDLSYARVLELSTDKSPVALLEEFDRRIKDHRAEWEMLREERQISRSRQRKKGSNLG
jgi:hypothetical protein